MTCIAIPSLKDRHKFCFKWPLHSFKDQTWLASQCELFTLSKARYWAQTYIAHWWCHTKLACVIWWVQVQAFNLWYSLPNQRGGGVWYSCIVILLRSAWRMLNSSPVKILMEWHSQPTDYKKKWKRMDLHYTKGQKSIKLNGLQEPASTYIREQTKTS